MASKSPLELWQEKLKRLQSARVLATDESVKMQLDYQIQECKEHIQELGGEVVIEPQPESREQGGEVVIEPQPESRGQRHLSNVELKQVRDLLLACPSFRNSQQRDLIINTLRPEISGSITRSDNANADTINIINCVRNYSGGMEELLSAIELFEGGSLPFKELKSEINKIYG
jgi:hypothetical protein